MPESQAALIPIARDPIAFTVPGVPVPWGRTGVKVIPKKVWKNGRTVTKHIPILYTPEETRAAEEAFLLLARPYRPRPPFSGPLRVDLTFYVPIPSSWSPREQAAAEAGAVRPTGRPDVDNYKKLVFDALNEVFWRDDSIIVEGDAQKWYGRVPRTEVVITPLAEE